jgi:hypothetical protein
MILKDRTRMGLSQSQSHEAITMDFESIVTVVAATP